MEAILSVGVVLIILISSIYIKYRYSGEIFIQYPYNLFIFLIRDRYDKIIQIKLIFSLVFVNRGFLDVEIENFDLKLVYNTVVVPLIFQKDMQSISGEKEPINSVLVNKGSSYNKLFSFVADLSDRNELRPLLDAESGKESLKGGTYELRLVTRSSTNRKQSFAWKINLSCNSDVKLIDTDGKNVILPMLEFINISGAGRYSKKRSGILYR